ncbi:hypothetical protein BDZ91DRAFT_793784 [Kalaharituber pfeilii]|nr:hypothetical protein BDZ91DRAFT_793784 [Kalaharituber pfeilii]
MLSKGLSKRMSKRMSEGLSEVRGAMEEAEMPSEGLPERQLNSEGLRDACTDERRLERGLGEMEEAVGWLWDAAISRDAQLRDIELGALFGSAPGKRLVRHLIAYDGL